MRDPTSTTYSTAAPARDKLTRDERRSHLLDVAGELLVAGEGPLSMESLARAAGVSKALPYKHFDNVAAVLAALYTREAVALGGDVWRALSDAGPDADLVQVWVSAYFSSLALRAPVLRALSLPGSGIPSFADPRGTGAKGVAVVLREFLGVDRARAAEISGALQGAIVGAAVTWLSGSARRRPLEALVVTLIRTAVGAHAPAARRPATQRPRGSR